ncbi:NAD-dependent epimerase/dehydratase family protein [Bombilactobacillus folatiphilus]|uniref:NAD-dependent epimerase/dehydratase family protein n=1 Tax=Bombilactobacillus folatiphilus TaxID=2923362 RepID=A0ABY4PBE7_9LACO|nr:NAD-dependent epimerase/dehydratase family protein [Bombilactobacillus folatiphilus]UQS82930.1 NAD-dependent epimerase/dehydratase family protein [Bombilactobacillus folatiphilus]
MHVGIMGGSGFVGQGLLQQLQTTSWQVTSFSCSGNRHVPLALQDSVQFVQTDFIHDKNWQPWMQQCDWLIDLVGIFSERPRQNLTYQQATFMPAKVVADFLKTQQLTPQIIYVSANWAPSFMGKYLFYKDKTALYWQQQLGSVVRIVYPNLIYSPQQKRNRWFARSWSLIQWLPQVQFFKPMTLADFSQNLQLIMQDQPSFLLQRRHN